MSTPKGIYFEEAKPENNHRAQYQKRISGTGSVITNEVSSFSPRELEAIAEDMRQREQHGEKLPYRVINNHPARRK
jgi:hypothetical protein